MSDAAPRPGRRRFLNGFVQGTFGLLLAWIVYPVLRFVSPPDVPEASTSQVEGGYTNDPELREKGFKIVRFGADPVILIRVADDDYRAFSATCTHLACIVEYQQKERRIWCNCHNGQYDLQGRVTGGPPPRPLARFDVELVDQGDERPRAIVVSRA